MIVENPEAFKAWMTTVLEPLCDADPEALAKYVYALVKKDKPTEELRKCMVSQLEVFLQKETKDFVDLLFTKLETGISEDYNYVLKIKQEPSEQTEPVILDNSYERLATPPTELVSSSNVVEDIKTDNCPPVPGVENDLEIDQKPQILTEPKPIVPLQCATEQTTQVTVESPRLRNGSFGPSSALIKPEGRRLSSSRSHDRKSDSEREDRLCSLRRRGSTVSPLRRLERSRSRSWERRSTARRSRSKSRRSRSRGRERERSRGWRNKSSSRSRAYDRDRKMRSWSKSPPPRSRSRSPLSRIRMPRYRRSPPFTRSRSRSFSPYDSPPLKTTSLSGGATPTQDSNHGDDLRVSLGSQNIQSVVNVKEPHSKKRRCRDFDEKGYCMRGEMCPYDHGKDPVVLEDVGQVLSFSAPGVQGLPAPSGLEVPVPGLGVPLLQPALAPGLVQPRPQIISRPPPSLSEYNPDAPSMEPRMWSKQPFRTSGRGLIRGGNVMRSVPGFPHHHQRELISVPVMEDEDAPFYSPLGNSLKRHRPPELSSDLDSVPPIKQRFDYSRLGSRRGNCSLHLKKIPSGLNNIAHLHNHFFKFGKIVKIQVCFEGDQEAALITFTNHAEASAAYKSTEAVLNNRFIKMFWYNADKDDKQENVSPINRTSAKERLGVPVMPLAAATSKLETSSEMEKVFISGSNITKTVYIPTSLDKKFVKSDPKKLLITTNFSNSQEMQITKEALRKKQELKRKLANKDALKIRQDINRKKQDMIDDWVATQSTLLERLEKGTDPPEKRAEIVRTIDEITDQIKTIRNAMKASLIKPQANALKVTPQLVKRTREEVGGMPASPYSQDNNHTQKQILDAELDLFNEQQKGKNTAELQKRVMELKNKAHNLGLLASSGMIRLPRGGARYRAGRGRGVFNSHSTVDHRPTKLLVSGFESDDKAEVLEHFQKFGEVVDHVWDEATPALVIQFKTRKDAEAAMAKGRNFQDRLMSVTWFNPAQTIGMRGAGMRSVILLNDNVGDLLSEHDEEEEALRINIDANEDFLLQDEEDEEDEERSWRR